MALLLLLVPWMSSADVLGLAERESLTGDLTRVVDGILVFRTSLQGQMMVPVSEVRLLQTEGRWIITMEDGNVHVGQFTNEGVVLDGDPGQVAPLQYAAINKAQSAPPQPEEDRASAGERSSWRNQIAVGVQSHDGRESQMGPFFQWEGFGLLAEDSLGLRLRFDVPLEDRFGDYVRGDFEYRAGVATPWSPYVQVTAARDVLDGLDWQTGLALGLSYDFSSQNDGEIIGYVGVAASYSTWQGRDDSLSWLRRRHREDEVEVSPHLGVAHRTSIVGGGNWDSRLSVSPGLSMAGGLEAEASTAVTFPLGSRLHLRLDVLLSYDDAPIFDALERLDTRLGAGIQVDF